jgi:hypothetical protein
MFVDSSFRSCRGWVVVAWQGWSVREGCEEVAGGGEEVGPWGALSRTVGWGWEFLEVCQGDGGGEVFGVGPGDAAVVA